MCGSAKNIWGWTCIQVQNPKHGIALALLSISRCTYLNWSWTMFLCLGMLIVSLVPTWWNSLWSHALRLMKEGSRYAYMVSYPGCDQQDDDHTGLDISTSGCWSALFMIGFCLGLCMAAKVDGQVDITASCCCKVSRMSICILCDELMVPFVLMFDSTSLTMSVACCCVANVMLPCLPCQTRSSAVHRFRSQLWLLVGSSIVWTSTQFCVLLSAQRAWASKRLASAVVVLQARHGKLQQMKTGGWTLLPLQLRKRARSLNTASCWSVLDCTESC